MSHDQYEFMPSPGSYYGAADWSQVVSSAVEIGGGLASQAIAQGAPRKKKKKKKRARDGGGGGGFPVLPIALGVGALGLIGVAAMMGGKKAPAPAAA